MGLFHVIWTLIVGFVVGLIARALLPGAQSMGFFLTSIVGIVGSFVGGFVGSLISKPEPGSRFHAAGFIMSVLGAILVLWLWKTFAR